jgi:hypothetical protein
METTFPARGTLAPSILSSLPSGRTRALSLSRSLSPFTTSLLPTLCRSQSIPYTLSRALILSRSGAGFSPLFSSLRRPGKRKRLGMTASENQASHAPECPRFYALLRLLREGIYVYSAVLRMPIPLYLYCLSRQ